MQRLYGKYLRAESFRKALVYQKKYLLLLLGGFQDCEEATLSMIAKLGGHPNEQDLNRGPPDPLTRFRSAARVVVALTRWDSETGNTLRPRQNWCHFANDIFI